MKSFNNHRLGELSTTLALLALLSLTIGVVFRASQVTNPDNKQVVNSRAQESACPYKAEVKVYKNERKESALFTTNEASGWTVVNDAGHVLDLKTNDKTKVLFETPSMILGKDKGSAYDADDQADVRLVGPDPRVWKVKEAFCTQAPGSKQGCPGLTTQELRPLIADWKIDGFRVNCNVDVSYGWVLEKRNPNDPDPTTNPNPTSAEPTKSTDVADSVEVSTFLIRGAEATGNLCDLKYLESHVDNQTIFRYLKNSTVRIQNAQNDFEVKLTKRQDQPSVLFSNVPVGSYTADIDGQPYAVDQACQPERTFTFAKGEKAHIPIVLTESTGGQCSIESTCNNCKADGKACTAKLSSNWLCCTDDRIKPTDVPQPTTDPNEPTGEPEPTDGQGPIPSQINPNPTEAFGEGPCEQLPGSTGSNHTVVFIGEGFNTYDDFRKYALTAVDEFRKTNLDEAGVNFRFLAHPNLGENYSCVLRPFFKCTGGKIANDLMKQCDGDSGVVITNKVKSIYGYADRTNKIGFVTTSSVVSSVAHEAGHAAANLYDAYGPNGAAGPGVVPDKKRINCAPQTDSSCKQWQCGGKDCCFKGCYYSNWYRSADFSVMTNCDSNVRGCRIERYGVTTWSPVEIQAWQNNMRSQSFLSQSSSSFISESYVITLNQKAVNDIEIQAVNPKSIYPDYPNTTEATNYYLVKTLDKKGAVLFETRVPQYDEAFAEGFEIEPTLRKSATIYAPYSKDVTSIVVEDSQGKRLATKTLRLSTITPPVKQQLCGNNICDLNESTSSCSQDCKVTSSASLAPLRAVASDINEDGVVNAIDAAICYRSDEYGKSGYELQCDLDYNRVVDSRDITILFPNYGKKIK